MGCWGMRNVGRRLENITLENITEMETIAAFGILVFKLHRQGRNKTCVPGQNLPIQIKQKHVKYSIPSVGDKTQPEDK